MLHIKPEKVLLTMGMLVAGMALAGTKPNVVIIYGDDVGYGDVGAYGSKMMPTPNIDRLAAQGLLFTDGHCSAATCNQEQGICINVNQN